MLMKIWLAENQIPFYADSGRFIRFSNGQQSTPTSSKIQTFLGDLKKERIVCQ